MPSINGTPKQTNKHLQFVEHYEGIQTFCKAYSIECQIFYDYWAFVLPENYVLPGGQQPLLIRLCGFVIGGLYYSFNLDAIVFAPAAVLFPSSPELISSLTDYPTRFSWITLFSVVFQWYVIYVFLANIFLIIFCVFIYVFSALEIIKELG